MINNFCELLAEIMRYGDTADGSIGLLPEGIVVVYCQDTVEMAASGNHGIQGPIATGSESSSILLSMNTLSSRAISPRTTTPLPQDILCPHCDRVLTTKTYKRHRHLFYDAANSIWLKETYSAKHQEQLG